MGVDLSGPLLELIKKRIARAQLYLKGKLYKEASDQFRQASEFLKKYANYAPNPQIKKERIERAKKFQKYSEDLLEKDAGVTEEVKGELIEHPPKDEVLPEIGKLIFSSKVTWRDIGGLNEVKEKIKYSYGLALANIQTDIKLIGSNNMLFYGPPGTGKTLLAAATSNGLDAVFYNVKVSNILSKFFGESSKIFSALYEAARKTAPSVIFLDEFESLTPTRGNDDSGAERRLLSTILSELDGLTEKDTDKYILTIAATNSPWLMDEAVLSRFQKRINIPLPDHDARKNIFIIHLKNRGFTLDCEYDYLAKRTCRFSGREIERICQEAVENMISDMNTEIPKIVEKGREAIQNYNIKVRPLNKNDFDRIFSVIKPQTSLKPSHSFGDWVSNEPSN